MARSTTAPLLTRSATPTAGGLLAPPPAANAPLGQGVEQGSIAVRAMRSMRSLARMGSWAQLKSMPAPTAMELKEEMERELREETANEKKGKKKDGTVKEKKERKKGGTVKEKKVKKENKLAGMEAEGGAATKKKSLKKSMPKAQTLRVSTSSFEVGALTASSPEQQKTLGPKKHSILGLGLPSTMRLPNMRGGSTASSINFNVLGSHSNPGPAPTSASVSINPNAAASSLAVAQPNRLSVDSAIALAPNSGRERAGSVASSAGSSLRPISVASSNSRLSSGSSVSAGSVKWDEEGLETVREQRRKEREAVGSRRVSEDGAIEVGKDAGERTERRTSRESRRSSEGRRRTPLSSVFPEVQHHQIGAAMLLEEDEEGSKIEGRLADSSIEFARGGVVESQDDRRMSLEAPSFLSTSSTSSSMRMGGRRGSYGPYPILTIEEATSDGHGCADYDEPLREGEIGGRYALEMARERLEGLGKAAAKDVSPSSTPMKKPRPRPMSEQLLSKMRPKPTHAEDDEGIFNFPGRCI